MQQDGTDFNLFKKLQNKGANSKAKPPIDQPPDENHLPENLPVKPIIYKAKDWSYDMSGDKIMYIFNHYEYKERVFCWKKLPTRIGTDMDVEALTLQFEARGFRVKEFKDKTHAQIKKIVATLAEMQHAGTSCVALAVLTHGDAKERIAAFDKFYPRSDLMTPLQDNKTGLVGKPKILIVQACRGGYGDKGQEVEWDGPSQNLVLPTHTDCLVIYSSVEGLVSWRNSNGSWLVSELCLVMGATHRSLDLLRMTTVVTARVALLYTSQHPTKPELRGFKQTVETSTTLTKMLWLSPPAAGSE